MSKLLPEFTRKHKFKAIVIGFLVLIFLGLGAQIYHYNQRAEAYDRQNAEFNQLTQGATLQDALERELQEQSEKHLKAQNLFKDLTNSDFQRPSCAHLENRPAVIITSSACDYYLRAIGDTNMAVVLLYDRSYSRDDKQFYANKPQGKSSMFYTNTYLRKQAARYGVNDVSIKFELFGPYKTTSHLDGFDYAEDAYKILKIFQKTSAKNMVPESNYDMVHYVQLAGDGGGVAFPDLHRAFTLYGELATFIHETLHLFRASDKYNNNDCATRGTGDPFGRYNGTQPGEDIMCSTNNIDYSNINDITAREIGWKN